MRTYLEKKEKNPLIKKLFILVEKVAIKTLRKLSIIQMTSSIIQSTFSSNQEQQAT